jgi:hypothetical protein
MYWLDRETVAEDSNPDELYERLEKTHGDSLEELSYQAFTKSIQQRMDVQIITDSDNNPIRVELTFGPHHFIEIGLVGGKVHVLKGETHHGTMYDASLVGSEWESVTSDRKDVSETKIFDDLPSEHNKINFQRVLDELTQYYLRPTEE